VSQQLTIDANGELADAFASNRQVPTPPDTMGGHSGETGLPALKELRLDWPLRVLIVDDAASTRRFLRGVLEFCPQFDVAGEADDGTKAIDMARALQPDVVLLDLSMPETDGSSALVGLLQVAPSARVIVVSGMDEKVAPPLLAAGATAFIAKGLPPFALLERLGSVLGRPVTLPRSTRTDDGDAEPAEPVFEAQPRAVICDDDPMARHMVAQVLVSCDVSLVAETDVVPNLLSVVELAKPEIIVLDLWLEGTPGTSAFPEIRRVSPRSLVVVYSAFEEWRDKALAAGAAAFVAKPHFYDLEAAINGLVPGLPR
jgi:DNA-binding NarL/FixJ family response regulator